MTLQRCANTETCKLRSFLALDTYRYLGRRINCRTDFIYSSSFTCWLTPFLCSLPRSYQFESSSSSFSDHGVLLIQRNDRSICSIHGATCDSSNIALLGREDKTCLLHHWWLHYCASHGIFSQNYQRYRNVAVLKNVTWLTTYRSVLLWCVVLLYTVRE